MAHNSLYPSFVKVFYTVSSLQHVQTLPVLAYEGVGGWWLQNQSSSVGQTWEDSMALYDDILKIVLSTTNSVINFAELWTYDSEEGDPIFRETFEIDTIGTWATAPVQMGQLVLSFRTALGGVLKTYVMETPAVVNQILTPPTMGGTQINAYRNWVLGSTGFVVGRDGSFPIAVIRGRTKTNDALRKKRQLFS